MGRGALWIVTLAAIACGGGDGTEPGADADPNAPDASTTPAVDAAACAQTTLSDLSSVVAIPDSSSSGDVFAAASDGGGAVVAWTQSGSARIVEVDAAGVPVGTAHSVDGDALYGLAVDGDAWSVLVSRGSDELFLVSITSDGAPRFETRVLGAVSHDVTNNEWFGPFIREGRLIWTGSEWAAYYTVQRLWPDDIAHYGDQLKLFDDSGDPVQTVWGWGCSHSMEVRLAHNGTELGPVCASDCFPDKGVHYAHRTFVYGDDAADCSGGYTAHLGGIVAVDGGFYAGFTSAQDRPARDAAIVHIADDKTVDPITWLTDGGDVDDLHIGSYGSGLVAAWDDSGTAMFQRLDSQGLALGAPESVAGVDLSTASDMFSYANGDVGWAVRGAGSVSVGRLGQCAD